VVNCARRAAAQLEQASEVTAPLLMSGLAAGSRGVADLVPSEARGAQAFHGDSYGAVELPADFDELLELLDVRGADALAGRADDAAEEGDVLVGAALGAPGLHRVKVALTPGRCQGQVDSEGTPGRRGWPGNRASPLPAGVPWTATRAGQIRGLAAMHERARTMSVLRGPQ